MAVYDIKLTDNSVTNQLPDASTKFDKIFGGGLTQTFGGINDSPGSHWTWVAVAAGVLLLAGYWLFGRKEKT